MNTLATLLAAIPLLTSTENTVQGDTEVITNMRAVVTEVRTELGNKQHVLTAGDNITIEDNVISASGGGGSTIEPYPDDNTWAYHAYQASMAGDADSARHANEAEQAFDYHVDPENPVVSWSDLVYYYSTNEITTATNALDKALRGDFVTKSHIKSKLEGLDAEKTSVHDLIEALKSLWEE